MFLSSLKFNLKLSFGIIIVCISMVMSNILYAQEPAKKDNDPVVVKLNGMEIHKSEILSSTEELPAQYRQQIDVLFPMFVERFVTMKLFTEEGRKLKLEQGDDVKKQMLRFEDEAVRNAFVRNYLEQKITEPALKTRYEKFVKEFPNQTETRASHILVDNEDEAKSIIKQLEGGADFANLAKEKSKDKASGAQGGDLGYFLADQMVPEFSKAIEGIDVGKTSKEAVKSPFGWHIIKVVDKRKKQPPSFEEAKDDIRQSVSVELIEALAKDLKAKAKIEYVDKKAQPQKP
ncbi:MAG: peptidylprolyl isomerase [Alphaproteobacteria bacterium]|nr:peptidylprolyl isomerase [Alphaproteobacteria bacterium]